MQASHPFSSDHQTPVPNIVPNVLKQAARFRMDGLLSEIDFQKKLHRLAAEELNPRQLELYVRDLHDGTTRFLIKETRTGHTIEMIDCPAVATGRHDGNGEIRETGPIRKYSNFADSGLIDPLTLAQGSPA